MASDIEITDLASNDPSGGFYEFIPPELSTAVAALRPPSMTRDEYHLSIMRDFSDAVKARKAPKELADTARTAVFKEHMLARFTIGPDVGQTAEDLEVSLQQSSKARLSSIIEAACTYHVEIARTARHSSLPLSIPHKILNTFTHIYSRFST